MRAAIYARSAQEDRTAIERQLVACRVRAGELGLSIDESQIYVDCGVPGNNLERLRQLQKLMSAAESVPRPFDYVLFTDVSRLGRDLLGVIRLLDRLSSAGVTTHHTQGGRNEGGNICALLVGLATTDVD